MVAVWASMVIPRSLSTYMHKSYQQTTKFLSLNALTRGSQRYNRFVDSIWTLSPSNSAYCAP